MKNGIALVCVSVSLFALSGISGCRSQDFLYYQPAVERPALSVTQKIKEIQGESQVDVLWVIDNSGSMGQHQRNVERNSDLFMQQFSKGNLLQWKMGLISTDPSDAPYVGMGSSQLDWTVQDPVAVFVEAVSRLGTNGSYRERTFEPVERALLGYGTSFLRDKAVMALIIVTDAPEQSDDDPKDFLHFLEKKKKSLDRVITYGVLGPQDFGCEQTDDAWDYKGSRYESVITATRGKTYKLCSNDFGKNLADLGQDLVSRVSNPKIHLSQRPKISSIRVIYNGQLLRAGPKDQGGLWVYDYELNAVAFHDLSFAPGEDEQVTVEYEVDDGL